MSTPITWKNDGTENWQLARFVITSSKLVSDILNGAESKLQELSGSRYRTFSQATQEGGFQVSAEAIYTHIKNERRFEYDTEIAYDSSTTEQWIRLPNEIQKTNLKATCLDMSLLVASCFARAGIPPIVIVRNGHAFIAFRTSIQESTKAELSLIEMRSLTENTEIIPVETTTLASNNPFGDYKRDFSESVELAKNQLLDVRDESFRCAVDVYAAWESGVERIHEPRAIEYFRKEDQEYPEDMLCAADLESSRGNWIEAAILQEKAIDAALLQRNKAIAKKAAIAACFSLYQNLWSNPGIKSSDPDLFYSEMGRFNKSIALAENLLASKETILHLQMLKSTIANDPEETMLLAEQLLEAIGATRENDDWLNVESDAINLGLNAAFQISDEVHIGIYLRKSMLQERRLRHIISAANDLQVSAEDIAMFRQNLLLLLATRVSVEISRCDNQESRLGLVEELSNAVSNVSLDTVDVLTRITAVIGRLAESANRQNYHLEAIGLLRICFELFEKNKHASQALNACMQIGELYSVVGDPQGVALWFSRSEKTLEQLVNTKDEQLKNDLASRKCMLRAALGRSQFRLGELSTVFLERIRDFKNASRTFSSVIEFIDGNSMLVRGDVNVFVADVHFWLGLTYQRLGDFRKAASHFAKCSTAESLLENPGFWKKIGADACTNEIGSWVRSGNLDNARACIGKCRSNPLIPEKSKEVADYFGVIIEEDLQPVIDWFDSEQSRDLRNQGLESVAKTISEIVVPLSEWWSERGFDGNDLLYDFWGRGAFSRIASAIRGAAYDVIAVDASTIDEIRNAARVFCPLFETVLIKWKGPLSNDGWLAPCLIPDVTSDFAPGFGGHGYTQAAGSDGRWAPAIVTGNYLGNDIVKFIQSEAYNLFKQGRLLICPAPLIGCTQTSVGWSDDLLLDSFLSGVVSTAGESATSVTGLNSGRSINLCDLRIPFMRDVSLPHLADSLDQLKEFTSPLRELIGCHLQTGDLKTENWSTLSKISRDFKDASRFFGDRLRSFGGGKYDVIGSGTGVAVTAMGREDTMPGSDPVTDLLRSLCPLSKDSAPYVVFWQLQTKGGTFDWTCPIDNPNYSKPNALMPDVPFSNRMRGWLVPGTLGVRLGRVLRA